MSEIRKIAAILVTDVVGYSRLAGAAVATKSPAPVASSVTTPAEARHLSLVVLPFANLSNDSSVLEKFAALQLIDVHIPTTDGREIQLTRHTEPQAELKLVLDKLKLELPPQPPPRIASLHP